MSSLLIVAALKDEVRTVLERMAVDARLHLKPATAIRGKLWEREVSVLLTGMGRARTTAALQAFMALERPDFILQVGYAGGATPVVGVGELVLAEKLIESGGGRNIAATTEWILRSQEKCKQAGMKATRGAMLTVDRAILSPHEKAYLGALHGALALDMESFWTAEFAEEHNIPWLVVKAILDPVEMELPNFSDAVDTAGDIPPGKALQHFARQPKDFLAVPKLQTHAHQAREAVFRFVQNWLQG